MEPVIDKDYYTQLEDSNKWLQERMMRLERTLAKTKQENYELHELVAHYRELAHQEASLNEKH